MANFNTHLITASAVSGVASGAVLSAGLAKPVEVILYFSLGTVGGLLPDLDSDNSVLLRIIFSLLAVFAGFAAMFRFVEVFSLTEFLLIWLISFLAIYFGVFAVFKNFTVHRGIFHSIPAAGTAAILTTLCLFHVFNFEEATAWMGGLFTGMGFLIHLILDEIYSVDLTNRRIKKSSGSALKLYDPKNYLVSILIYLGLLSLLLASPDSRTFWQRIRDPRVINQFQQRLYPSGEWFRRRSRPTD